MAKWYTVYLHIEPEWYHYDYSSPKSNLLAKTYPDVEHHRQAIGEQIRSRGRWKLNLQRRVIPRYYDMMGQPIAGHNAKHGQSEPVFITVLKFKNKNDAIHNKLRFANSVVNPHDYNLSVGNEQLA